MTVLSTDAPPTAASQKAAGRHARFQASHSSTAMVTAVTTTGSPSSVIASMAVSPGTVRNS